MKKQKPLLSPQSDSFNLPEPEPRHYSLVSITATQGGNWGLKPKRYRKPKGKNAYSFRYIDGLFDGYGKYVRVDFDSKKKQEFYTASQVKNMNNLIYAINEIYKEIERIKTPNKKKPKKKVSHCCKSKYYTKSNGIYSYYVCSDCGKKTNPVKQIPTKKR